MPLGCRGYQLLKVYSPKGGVNMVTSYFDVGSAPAYHPYSNSIYLDDYYTDDVYTFSVDQTSSINLNLHNITANDDADLELYEDTNNNGVLDDTDQYLAGSWNGGNSDDSINYQVTAGNYLAQVYHYDLGSDGWLNYDLDLSATPIFPFPANDPAQAPNLLPREVEVGHIALGSLDSETITQFGWVGHDDNDFYTDSNTADTYHFSASGSNDGVDISVDLTGLSSDADIRLIQDHNWNQIVDPGEVIASSTFGGSSSESFSTYVDNFDLASYDHFVQVYQYYGNTNYDLNMTFESVIG
ncbi:MAG: peptidase [Okeania sp. SIO2C2]|uniref:pre-peptidase C-terminal domain-containing protein n=1 Tax=Okeania sp. SIO2C2 TaxID=2607787 RepID=UPI0013BE8954|nr:pre-peptidase C-terminal domain-containing protein [Okeania sp. SIO2C2]NEP89092.1 peptidase [Okeania sp. SIO2C2]